MDEGEFRIGWCRSCEARIIWARTDSRALMPVDEWPSTAGNVLLHPRRGHSPRAEVCTPGSVPGRLRTPHHMTCPQGSEWRRRKG
jgi:hypothetical protein